MTTHEKALEAVFEDMSVERGGGYEAIIERAITVYLSALLPEDVTGLVEQLGKLVDAQIDDNLDYIRQADQMMNEAVSIIQSQAVKVAELEVEVARERHRATNAEYFNVAYRNMLGPIGRQVAEMWREKNVRRVHFDWGPEADNLTGEERAKIILDVANVPRREALDFGDSKGPRTKDSRSFDEFIADLDKKGRG